ncbi:hypothetical protein DFA_03763 [Cavenderia fasciculata]|uniref:MHD domain-containing protein n=1 Tax=Cavenderia fasciculata TaxID=261658 RepID=F4Q0C0_CACFS|nr:uncharacterized protein DFA_03763 [Cavenderia fasciculata]EGG18271.1 hypothetical protein DFA_03763 [Cavenderia fasciculata]|eukprot:XP_004357094.1 hypothetical protein DFA_03763 [Cavenderia fasciculata]
MCTLRGIWILKEHNNGIDVVFSKRINTVEVRVRLIAGSNYIPIPNDNELLRQFSLEILYPQKLSKEVNPISQHQQHQSSFNHHSFQSQQSSPSIIQQQVSALKSYQATPNTHIVSLFQDRLWPIIYLKKKNYYFLTIPVIEEYLLSSNHKPSLIELPSITSSITFLEDVSFYTAAFLIKPPPYPELQVYMSNIIPFGQPVDSNFNNVKLMIKTGFPTTEVFSSKRPAWKPFLHKGKQQVDFIIVENVQGIQYDNPDIPDVIKVFGSVYCRADLEGMPEVSAYFNFPSNNNNNNNNNEQTILQQPNQPLPLPHPLPFSFPTITHMSIDPTVQTTSDVLVTNKITFTPPLDIFKVLGYGVSDCKVFPLRGFYQMKEIGPNIVKVLVQLKLAADMTNSFEYCLLKMPFKNRGNILNIHASPTNGTVHIEPNLKSLVWNIGQKFSGRNLEVALPAEITFVQMQPGQQPIAPTLSVTGSSGNNTMTGFPSQSFASMTESIDEDDRDPFCQGTNTFVRLFFKLQHCTLSGFGIDPKRVTVYPTSKSKVNVDREIISSDYVIWNSLGSAKHSYHPENQIDNNEK